MGSAQFKYFFSPSLAALFLPAVSSGHWLDPLFSIRFPINSTA